MKFYNFYGQPGARLEANLSVYKEDEDGDKKSFLFATLDTFLFYAPSAQIKELKDIWVDDLINLARWEAFSSKLGDEWNGITIYVSRSPDQLAEWMRWQLTFEPRQSTVMLAVDVSFLAVPDVGSQSVTTIAIYMSLLTIVGSLLSSLLLASQRRAQDDSASSAVRCSAWCLLIKYLINFQASFIYTMTRWGGFTPLGIVYSLPFALLIWAYVLTVILRELTELTEL